MRGSVKKTAEVIVGEKTEKDGGKEEKNGGIKGSCSGKQMDDG